MERRHLFRLAATSDPASGGDAGTFVRAGLELVVQELEPTPAVLLSRRLDLLVWNPTAAAWWESHDVAEKRHGSKRYIHPTVGPLTIHYEAMPLAGDGDQLLTLYAAQPGTRDAERLAQLSAPSTVAA